MTHLGINAHSTDHKFSHKYAQQTNLIQKLNTTFSQTIEYVIIDTNTRTIWSRIISIAI